MSVCRTSSSECRPHPSSASACAECGHPISWHAGHPDTLKPRKIIALCGIDARIAVCDDGTVWLWHTTGISGRWVPWDRPPIPQPEIPVETLLPSPTFSQAARDAEHQRRANLDANKDLDELCRQQEPPPVPPGIPPAPGQSPAVREADRRQRGGRR